MNAPDVLVVDTGSLWTLCPMTGIAKQWIEDNVFAEDYQWFGNALCVEPRYVAGILEGMKSAGLVIGAR